MDLKSVIRPLVPPIIYEAAHRIKVAIMPPSIGPPTVTEISVIDPETSIQLAYSSRPSFAEAAIECGRGYAGEQMLEKALSSPHAWLHKMQDYGAPILASVALAAMNAKGARLKVLDFGGGIGIFKAYVHDYFDERVATDWTVVEIPEQVAFNQDCVQDNLRFSTSVGPGPYDLAIFCGSLQYVDDWQSVLRATDADLVLVSRTAVADLEQAYVQTIGRDGHLSRVPARVLPRPELFALLSERHELFASWDFKNHLVEMGSFDAPAMLWRLRPVK
jgi:putative methyltransferase (TIGR04325 family)